MRRRGERRGERGKRRKRGERGEGRRGKGEIRSKKGVDLGGVANFTISGDSISWYFVR